MKPSKSDIKHALHLLAFAQAEGLHAELAPEDDLGFHFAIEPNHTPPPTPSAAAHYYIELHPFAHAVTHILKRGW